MFGKWFKRKSDPEAVQARCRRTEIEQNDELHEMMQSRLADELIQDKAFQADILRAAKRFNDELRQASLSSRRDEIERLARDNHTIYRVLYLYSRGKSGVPWEYCMETAVIALAEENDSLRKELARRAEMSPSPYFIKPSDMPGTIEKGG